ncbi:hypothetical protein CPB97_002545 [Podila verticillata]|nr:hypothetical protein CPB97_002545 [Podila verticillata]
MVKPVTTSNVFNGNNIPSALFQAVQSSMLDSDFLFSQASLDEQVNDFAQLQAAIFQVDSPPRPHLCSKCFKN